MNSMALLTFNSPAHGGSNHTFKVLEMIGHFYEDLRAEEVSIFMKIILIFDMHLAEALHGLCTNLLKSSSFCLLICSRKKRMLNKLLYFLII
jgi:hypothetical protein